MSDFIRVMIVDATPMKGSEFSRSGQDLDGYKVINPDGRAAWYSKREFEKQFTEITYVGKSGSPVSQHMVDDFIKEVSPYTVAGKTTVVRALLLNGYEIVKSFTFNNEMEYNADVGFTICMVRIKEEVHKLLNFLIQTGIHGIEQPVPKILQEGPISDLNIQSIDNPSQKVTPIKEKKVVKKSSDRKPITKTKTEVKKNTKSKKE